MAACANNPSSPSRSSSPSASLSAPRPTAPATQAYIRNSDQPIDLTVQNVYSTQLGATHTFTVVTDAAFAATVQTKAATAAGRLFCVR
jgi:hypothetical protein